MSGLDPFTWVACALGCLILTVCVVVAVVYLIFLGATRGDD